MQPCPGLLLVDSDVVLSETDREEVGTLPVDPVLLRRLFKVVMDPAQLRAVPLTEQRLSKAEVALEKAMGVGNPTVAVVVEIPTQ